MNYPIEQIRKDFPILTQEMNGHPLVFFDNGATTQKPQVVIDSLVKSYSTCNANVHRGVYKMSRTATQNHEDSRATIASFIGANTEEILFTSGTTEGINLIAYTYGEANINEGDNIVVTMMDHHSNFVPWQQLALRKKARFTVVPLTDEGDIDRQSFKKALAIPHTKIVALPHVSNVLGTVNPIEELIKEIHAVGAIAAIDGAQAVAHMPIDVKKYDADFYTFSSHKMYGPTGIGALYGKASILRAMPPFLFGGEMIENVSTDATTFTDIPYKFEAGTPNFIGSVAFAEAVHYLESIGMDNIEQYEKQLSHYTYTKLSQIKGIQIVGNPSQRDPVLSFIPVTAHPYDLGLFLDQQGFALRSGHHCAEPLMHSLGLTTTLRLSLGLYNSVEEIDAFIVALERSLKMLS